MHRNWTLDGFRVNTEARADKRLTSEEPPQAVYIRCEALMPQPAASRETFRFDDYVLNLRAGELHKTGHKIKLQEQPLQILAFLLQHPGEAVTREELRRKLWPEDTFVDFDHSLNTAIKKLRQALNDEADKPRFIETLPRRGYRFIGSLAEDKGSAQSATPLPSAPESSAAEELVGGVFLVRDQTSRDFVCVPIDEPTLREKEKLEAADDNLGLSLLFSSEKLLLIRTGTRVKVLEGCTANSCYEVRILEGEHTAKTAIVLRKFLCDSA
jgi:DNA-binding winged helix-turn-helix (wHTH) protein